MSFSDRRPEPLACRQRPDHREQAAARGAEDRGPRRGRDGRAAPARRRPRPGPGIRLRVRPQSDSAPAAVVQPDHPVRGAASARPRSKSRAVAGQARRGTGPAGPSPCVVVVEAAAVGGAELGIRTPRSGMPSGRACCAPVATAAGRPVRPCGSPRAWGSRSRRAEAASQPLEETNSTSPAPAAEALADEVVDLRAGLKTPTLSTERPRRAARPMPGRHRRPQHLGRAVRQDAVAAAARPSAPPASPAPPGRPKAPSRAAAAARAARSSARARPPPAPSRARPGHLPEIAMIAGDGPQPGVLQLLCRQSSRQRRPASRKRLRTRLRAPPRARPR